MISDMINRSKGKYITQGVSFNKDCPRQMGLLKKALMASVSFSGLGKELLALKFDEKYIQTPIPTISTPKIDEKVTPIYQNTTQPISETTKIRKVGNFI